MTEGHHLVLGSLTDRLTGRTLVDTHDERYRQKIVGHLLDVCGFGAGEMAGRLLYAYEVDGSCPCDTSICKPGSGT